MALERRSGARAFASTDAEKARPMHLFDPESVQHVLTHYGYYAVAGVIMAESAGIPMPGETVLVTAAIYASRNHGLDIRLIVTAAALGAIIGDNIGFWVGRELGWRLLTRYGQRVGLGARKQKLGRYLFERYGGAVVFFGRFVAVLRTYAALLAGANRLRPLTFLIWNAMGGVVWASVYGFGAFLLGAGVERVAGPVGYVALALALVGGVVLWRFYKRHEEALLDRAERAADAADRDAGRPAVS